MLMSLYLFFLPLAAQPSDILSTFELHPEFQLELVAMEPVIFDPVDMEWDEHGKVYVLEMPGYPFGTTHGQVVVLKDDAGDGSYNRRVVFADGFPVADSILPWNGGILVASPPDLIFVKDTDGDDKADVREVLLSGFDAGNTQHNFNGLTHGLDNWIYAASGGNAGAVFWPGKPEEKTPLRWNDFRFDLKGQRFERIGSSSGGFGLALDPYGRIFGTHNTWHVHQLVFPGTYLDDIPGLNPDTLRNISDHEEMGTSRLFALGEQETRVNHPEQSGYFSGGCGITMYNGGAFGEAFDGNIFVNDVVVNLLHRDVLRAEGTYFIASRDRDRVEFLASYDRAVRPVNGAVGPDGAYYLLDMHRTVIEHPEWIPDELEKDMDVHAGMDKGRIFRIVPKAGLPLVKPSFPREDLGAVVRSLEHPNKWWRDTAQRLLVEWEASEATPQLAALLTGSESPYARVHALWTLAGLEQLGTEHVLAVLRDAEAGVRENALILAETRLQNPEILEQVFALAADEHARVRMWVALVLSRLDAQGEPQATRRQAALHEIITQDMDDDYGSRAVLAAAAQAPRPVLVAVLQDAPLLDQAGAGAFLGELAELIGRNAAEVDAVATLKALEQSEHAGAQAAVLSGLAEGLGTRAAEVGGWQLLRDQLVPLFEEASLSVVREAWRVANLAQLPPGTRQQELVEAAREAAADPEVPAPARLEHLALLELSPFEDRKELLFELLHSRHPREVQSTAAAQLTQAATPEVADRFLATWKTLGAPVRAQAGNMLLRKPDFQDRLLTALETGVIGLGEMNFDLERRRFLLWRGKTEDIRQRAAKLFNDAGVVTREAALEKMRPALSLAGDPERGRTIFQENCAKCHIISGEGHNVGPDLTDIFRKSKETLLHDILDPNAAVDTEFISFTIETAAEDVFDEQILTGMIVSETDNEVVLREAGGIDHTIPRGKIKNQTSTGLSMMPEELEAGLSPEQVADLLSYLQTPR